MTKLCNTCEYLKFCARSGIEDVGCDRYKRDTTTNEEWLDGLSTEEKAKFFHGIVIRTMHATWDGKKPDYPAYLSDWKKWLKEVHKE